MALNKLFQLYWRATRSLTMGAQGIVIDDQDRLLLVRHGYRPGWHFPGGGVEKNETVATALERELYEEVGVVATAPPVMHGLFANFAAFPNDHIAVFIVRTWRRDHVPEPNREIAEHGFFARNELPDGTVPGAHNRISEIFDGAPVTGYWAP
ncbi:MAG: NUDIX domain-containing protein [Pseudomonadota bacterium]